MAGPCVVGRLRITGEEVEFRPAERSASVTVGDEIELAVQLDYSEASHRRERCEISFDLHHPDEGVRTLKVQVEDRPALRDAGLGVLLHRTRFARAGDVRVRFALRVDAATGSWLGGTSSESAARHEGEVLVRVL